jgi:uncharacterized protein (DUF2147 family)
MQPPYNILKDLRYLTGKAMLVVALVFFAITVTASQPLGRPVKDEDAICGVWYTNNNNSKVQIYSKDGNYFGKIIWLKDASKSKYTNKHVIVGMTYNPLRQAWDSGTLYYPVRDAEYKGIIELRHQDTLLIRAYIGSPAIGKTITWTRAR